MEHLLALTAQMAREGIRRLLVLSGEPDVCGQNALRLRALLGGDGLWVGPQPVEGNYASPRALSTLLGREFHHAFFDARHGFDAAAFAALGGTLKAGSWLVLLVPPLDAWALRPDADSLRWSDLPQPIAVPHFVHHFRTIIERDEDVLIWQLPAPLSLPVFPRRAEWTMADGAPLAGQAQILQRLLAMPPGVAAVTAGRGRGKSALAGMLLAQLEGTAVVTAPAKSATDVMATFAGEHFHFMAPDALLASSHCAGWLIVDEAAAIPAPLLLQLTARFPRVLLTTTVQGYEGTGRGFLLKLCARFASLTRYSLDAPVRWATGCPLERVIANALLFDDEASGVDVSGELKITRLEQKRWLTSPAEPAALYQLLAGAHYRTSPLDLRRMMDAPGQHFYQARAGEHTLAALWLVEEGGLSAGLSQAVWAGFRRPRGNLVAQSLAAHGGTPLAATLKGLRVSRIAVHPSRQREGIGQRLIAGAVAMGQEYDYLSVSFGYTPELWRLWQRCGFTLVRIGSQREASSGCYTAMALLPISEAGRRLAKEEHRRLRRDLTALRLWVDDPLPVVAEEDVTAGQDQQELAGFAFGHRPLVVSAGALLRLLERCDLPLPALRGVLQRRTDEAFLVTELGLSGRKALLARQRQEAADALYATVGEEAAALREHIGQLQFF
ncbi:MAG TPA: GNAT family N-acetyltransferase [Enterobacteriaceae bacterium]|nr:GNAT family N-acetyltransferase [Enterobacteriaceae bacterium]